MFCALWQHKSLFRFGTRKIINVLMSSTEINQTQKIDQIILLLSCICYIVSPHEHSYIY